MSNTDRQLTKTNENTELSTHSARSHRKSKYRSLNIPDAAIIREESRAAWETEHDQLVNDQLDLVDKTFQEAGAKPRRLEILFEQPVQQEVIDALHEKDYSTEYTYSYERSNNQPARKMYKLIVNANPVSYYPLSFSVFDDDYDPFTSRVWFPRETRRLSLTPFLW